MKLELSNYPNRTIFVSATNTNVGKTYSCEKILKHFSNQNLKVGYFKPIETGVENSSPQDGLKMFNLVKSLNKEFEKLSINDIVPYQFKLPASPFVAKKEQNIDIEFLKRQKEFLLQFCDILIVEGAGGLMVPINLNFFMIDLIKEFDCKTFLICPSKLGSINDTLLSIEALENRKMDFDFFINLYEDKDSFEEVSKPFLEKYFDKLKFLQDL